MARMVPIDPETGKVVKLPKGRPRKDTRGTYMLVPKVVAKNLQGKVTPDDPAVNIKKYTDRQGKTPESRAKQLANLKPMKPGERVPGAGNYSLNSVLARHIRDIGEEVIDAEKGWSRIDAVIRRLYLDAMNGKTAATTLLLERGWGKVPAPVQVDLRADLQQMLEEFGLSLQEALSDPVLAQVLSSAGIIEGKFTDGLSQDEPLAVSRVETHQPDNLAVVPLSDDDPTTAEPGS